MILKNRSGQDGNSAIIVLVIVIVLLVLFAGILDVCRILISRERTRNAADAISLAVAQEMIFLEYQGLDIIAKEMACRHGCRLESLNVTYDMVTVSAVSEVELLFLDKIWHGGLKTIRSISAAEITYPWDSRLGLCRYYGFNFMDGRNKSR
ncbi:MAG: pilus assembly protein TadG-related protein [Actinobacteria bacterium]|nr:pilus assembly protein TadG-related protein [Actinomycetota bacterium]